MTTLSFLWSMKVKEALSDYIETLPLYDTVMVKNKRKQLQGWIFPGCTYGCVNSDQEAVIFYGQTSWIATDKGKIISLEPEESIEHRV